MDHQSLTETSKSRKGPLVSEQEFVLIFVCFFERVLNAMISADISNLITLYVGPSKTLDWFNEAVRHSKYIDIVDGMNITKRLYAPGTVLCGDGEPLDRSRWTKYEVVFRINKMRFNFYIGYVFGSIEDFDFAERLGIVPNKNNSVGIKIEESEFYLYDEGHYRKQLNCEPEDGPSTFPEQEQIWRLSWDLLCNEMKILLMNQQETGWIPMTRYAIKQEHSDIIPAFTLCSKDDSIILLSE